MTKKDNEILRFKEGYFKKLSYDDSKQYFDEFDQMAKTHMTPGLSKTQIKKANAKIFNESREMLIKYKVHYYKGAFWKMVETEKEGEL